MSLYYMRTFHWGIVINTLSKLGKRLNAPSRRFIKGEIICKSICKASNGRLEYVDQVGYDIVDKKNGYRFEVRSLQKAFKKNGKMTSKGVVLKNIRGNMKFNKTFDWLLLVQNDPTHFHVAAISWDQCNQYLYINNDQIRMNSVNVEYIF